MNQQKIETTQGMTTTDVLISPLPEIKDLGLEALTRKLSLWYDNNCASEEHYTALGKVLRDNQLKLGLSPSHLKNRGDYNVYPPRMVTHTKDELFVYCAGSGCKRSVCTDAWFPLGYMTFHNRIIYCPTRNRYYCREDCYGKV